MATTTRRSVLRNAALATTAMAVPFVRGAQPAYTLELWLPRANPATFLANPR